ncbi:MAG: ATP-binding protein [Paludibacteraceae bacterium]|nr:ATP-binding protein [Paludibacteraceae bacterium]
MKTPFVYGIAADELHFTDREEETRRLRMNFENGINTIIISPRRWGKTSLVNYVAEQYKARKDIRVVKLDAFACRTPEDFYKMFATEIIRQTATKAEEWVANAKRFLSSLVPVVSVSSDPMNTFSLSMKIVDSNFTEEVLTLPERVATEKNLHIVVCIDEFQQIGEFTDSITFQKKLRSVWQHQHKTSYCLFGSKRHLLMYMFQKSNYPFYKFGDVLFLERIPLPYWTKYIGSRFLEAGKKIEDSFISNIYDYVDGNSSYIQQLAWIVLTRTQQVVTEDILLESELELIRQNNALFYEQMNNLTSYQIRFLVALIEGNDQSLSRKESIEEFSLGSSANVASLKKALQKKEIIDVYGNQTYFADPLFPHWLKLNLQSFKL